MIRKLLVIIAALVAVALLALGGTLLYRGMVERRDARERAASPQGPLPEAVTPLSYELRLRIDPTVDSFSGTSRIALRISEATDLIWLHGAGLRPSRVALTGEDGRQLALDYHEMGRSGVVRLAGEEILPPQEAVLEIDFSAPFNTRFEGLYKVSDEDQAWAFTQFAPLDARRAFPGFDEPRFKTPFTVTLEVRESHAAAANTPLLSEEALGDGFRRLRFATSKPLPTYLVAFAVGDLDVVEWEPVPASAVRPEPLPLRGLARRGRGPEMAYALANTARFVAALEEYFGSPFPFEKLDLVAVPEFTAGAMENVGLITYREKFLLLGDDPPVSAVRQYAAIHAHELAHMWHGNLVTMPWWDDVWLNEAFATWLGNKIADAWDPSFEFARSTLRDAHGVMRQDGYVSTRRIREPITGSDDIVNAFDGITYVKGGGVLHMLESYLGEERFRDGVRQHLARFPYGHARAEEFIDSLGQAAAEPGLAAAFTSFLEQPGVPLLEVDWRCDGGGVELDLAQSRYLPLGSRGSADQAWRIPLCLRLAGDGGERRECLLLEESQTRIDLPEATCPAVVVPNADAAGYYRWSLPRPLWRSLFARLDLLTPAERFSALDNLAAELRAGRVDAAFYLDAAAAYPRMREWDLVLAPLEELDFIVRYLAAGDDREALRHELGELYLPVLERVGWGAVDAAESPDDSLLREQVVRFLAFTARAPAVRQRLLELGRAYLGYQTDARLHPEALGDELVGPALGVALQSLGRPYFDALMQQFRASEDLVFRERALRAMGRITDLEIGNEVRDMLMSLSISFAENQALFLGQLDEPENQQAMFETLERKWRTVGLLVPDAVLARLSVVARGFCSMEQHAATRDFFGPRMEKVTGGPRVLASRLEAIETCAALVAEHGPYAPGT